MEESRLKIPLLFAADVIHGLSTIFPVPLAEAAAFDTQLAYRTARATAVETAASAVHQTYAPMVDVARDQRWGLRRVEDVVTAAEAQGLRLDRMVDMPANNLSLIFRRAAF